MSQATPAMQHTTYLSRSLLVPPLAPRLVAQNRGDIGTVETQVVWKCLQGRPKVIHAAVVTTICVSKAPHHLESLCRIRMQPSQASRPPPLIRCSKTYFSSVRGHALLVSKSPPDRAMTTRAHCRNVARFMSPRCRCSSNMFIKASHPPPR